LAMSDLGLIMPVNSVAPAWFQPGQSGLIR
jgi:hypothetical protein